VTIPFMLLRALLNMVSVKLLTTVLDMPGDRAPAAWLLRCESQGRTSTRADRIGGESDRHRDVRRGWVVNLRATVPCRHSGAPDYRLEEGVDRAHGEDRILPVL
jgi:hypothetical protein